MKILVVSDSHGDRARLENVLRKNADADALFFLGDGLFDLQALRPLWGLRPLFAVRGNCDASRNFEAEGFVTLAGVRFFYTHGHGYEVKMSLLPLAKAARAREAQVALYGHTHIPYYEYADGLTLFNPGSLEGGRAMEGSYGVIEVSEGQKPRFYHRDMA